MKIETLTIVGVGLIGGSIGLAAKKRGLARRVVGVGRNTPRLDVARSRGAIDEAQLDLATAMKQADIAVFCTPVDRITEQVLSAAPVCAPGTLLTDAGSTKAKIVAAIEGRLSNKVAFVGSHPLAGSEKHGPEHAAADLFVERWTVVTPTPKTDLKAVERTCDFWQALGARVRLMSPEDHDRALAVTSHLPHLAASALAGILPPELHELSATGFRDTTRVAAGDPDLWSAIFSHNRQALLDALCRYSDRVQEFRRALEAGDEAAIHDLLTQAKRVRDALGS